MKIYILITFLFSSMIYGMEEAPKQNSINRLAALPADVQTVIASYLTFDRAEDDALIEKVRADAPDLAEQDEENCKRVLIAEAKFVAEPRNPARIRTSEDGKKWLIKYTEAKDSTIGIYDLNTQQYTRLLWLSSDRYFPAAISDSGKMRILREGTNFSNVFRKPDSHIIDIYVAGVPKTKRIIFEKVIRRVCINKKDTKFAVLFADDSVKLFSCRSSNYPENLLGKYFRENRICRTLSRQNPHLRK